MHRFIASFQVEGIWREYIQMAVSPLPYKTVLKLFFGTSLDGNEHISLNICMDDESSHFETELESATGHSEASLAIEDSIVLCPKSHVTKLMRLILL